jgi:hypothetical protein
VRGEHGYASILHRVKTSTSARQLNQYARTGTTHDAPLNQHALLWRHPTHVFPPVILVPLHAIRLPVTIREFEGVRHEVTATVDAVEVAERKWPVERNVVDRPPEIDDLEAPL